MAWIPVYICLMKHLLVIILVNYLSTASEFKCSFSCFFVFFMHNILYRQLTFPSVSCRIYLSLWQRSLSPSANGIFVNSCVSVILHKKRLSYAIGRAIYEPQINCCTAARQCIFMYILRIASKGRGAVLRRKTLWIDFS